MRREDRYQVVNYFFGQDTLAATQTDVQLVAAIGESGQAVDGITMPTDWQAIMITADLSAAGSAGTLSVGLTKGGTEDADTTMSITTETSKRLAIPRGLMKGVAGDILGAEITTSGTWNGTTADLLVTAYILLDWGPELHI